MNWIALFTAILKLLEGILPILEDLFARASQSGSPDDLPSRAAVNAAFDRARAETWFWNVWTRRGLEAARAKALKRADELVAVARGQATAVPPLAQYERAEIREAAGL